MKCPGQDSGRWRPDDVSEASCARCGETVEFFRDDACRPCGRCGALIANPKASPNCAQWCRFVEKCLGVRPKAPSK